MQLIAEFFCDGEEILALRGHVPILVLRFEEVVWHLEEVFGAEFVLGVKRRVGVEDDFAQCF